MSSRPKRNRKPTRLGDDFVDLDSDEILEQAEEVSAGPSRKRRPARGGRSAAGDEDAPNAQEAPAAAAEAEAEAEVPAGDSDDYMPDDEAEAEAAAAEAEADASDEDWEEGASDEDFTSVGRRSKRAKRTQQQQQQQEEEEDVYEDPAPQPHLQQQQQQQMQQQLLRSPGVLPPGFSQEQFLYLQRQQLALLQAQQQQQAFQQQQQQQLQLAGLQAGHLAMPPAPSFDPAQQLKLAIQLAQQQQRLLTVHPQQLLSSVPQQLQQLLVQAPQPQPQQVPQQPQPQPPPPQPLTKKQQREKEEQERREANRRMCASYARKTYKLSEKDLAELEDVQYRKNPHYASAAPMRLYLVRELEALAARKAERKVRDAEEREERAAAHAEAVRARKAAAAAAAAEMTKGFGPGPKEQRHGSVQLPDVCLQRILGCVVASLEPGGLRGPSAVARDLANASLVCWDFYHAAKTSFVALSDATAKLHQAVPTTTERGEWYALSRLPGGLLEPEPAPTPRVTFLPPVGGMGRMIVHRKKTQDTSSSSGGSSGWDWAAWDDVLQRPKDLRLPQLKEACRALGLQVTGTKPELMLRVLDAFKLTTPTTAPAQLLKVLLLERWPDVIIWEGRRGGSNAGEQVRRALAKMREAGHPQLEAIAPAQAQGAAGLRAAITQAGFDSLPDFFRSVNDVWTEWQRQRQIAREAEQQRLREAAAEIERKAAERREAALAERRAAAAAKGQRQYGERACACGNAAAAACTRGCCLHCCRAKAQTGLGVVRCPRHNT